MMLPQVVREVGCVAARTRHLATMVRTSPDTAPSIALHLAGQFEVLPNMTGQLRRSVEVIRDGGGRSEVDDRHGDELWSEGDVQEVRDGSSGGVAGKWQLSRLSVSET